MAARPVAAQAVDERIPRRPIHDAHVDGHVVDAVDRGCCRAHVALDAVSCGAAHDREPQLHLGAGRAVGDCAHGDTVDHVELGHRAADLRVDDALEGCEDALLEGAR